MRSMLILLISVMIFSPVVQAAVISDVSVSDGSYRSIRRSIDGGYLSLFRNKTFQGSRAVTRKELAVVIDKLTRKMDQQRIQLSKSELQELLHLAKNFKSYLVNHESQVSLMEQTITNIQNDQKDVQYDLSQISDQLRQEVTELKAQNANNIYYIGGGILLASLLALMN